MASRRFEFVADLEWIQRIRTQAHRRCISTSAYLRQAVTRQLELDEADRLVSRPLEQDPEPILVAAPTPVATRDPAGARD